jgi:cystathionine beta-lyase/cystathionine gamma-synthase
MDLSKAGLETKLVHAGEARGRAGATVVPIHQASVWSVEASGYEGLRYPRYSNLPNHDVLAEKLAALEGAERALVTASGMAAISASLLSVLKAGDHLLALDSLYGGTHAFVTRRLPELGIEHDSLDGDDPASWSAKVRPNTRAIYVETATNPLVAVPDLETVVALARTHGLVSLVDNTFATPLGFRPAEHGFDLSLHSCTKYLNGHSDLVAGAVIGRADLVKKVEATMKLLGGSLDPHACFLLQRGMKTLALRLAAQSANALALAQALEAHPAVAWVRYPGLASHPHHARAARLLDGFGAMLAFEPKGGREAADRFLGRVRVATHAPSLGGVETLVVSPSRSSHAALSAEERAKTGITEGLIRVSVGIETLADLVADFDQALS